MPRIVSNPNITALAKKIVRPMNPDIMKGYAMRAMEQFEAHLDSQIRSITSSLPASLKYIGLQHCTPEEEFLETTKPRTVRGGRTRSSARQFDLADSFTYLTKVFFEYTDIAGKKHIISRSIYLPYLESPGFLKLSGNLHQVIPVISDKVFTPGKDTIFVRLTRDRNLVKQFYHSIRINGEIQTRYVAWFMIYRKNSTSLVPKTTKALTTLAHYVFAWYGVDGAFERYAGFKPVIGGSEITSKTHPPSDWTIISTAYHRNVPPSTCLDKAYEPSEFTIAIPNDKWNKQTEALCAGLFYVIDHFPSRLPPDPKQYNSSALWKILLGHILFSGLHGENKLYHDVEEHFESIKGNLDTEVKQKLAYNGIHLENYFDLLNYLLVECNTMLSTRKVNGLNVYGKNLEVLYYMAYNILEGFVSLNFVLSKMGRGRNLTLQDVSKIINTSIRMGAVFRGSGRINTSIVSSATDHMYPKITAILAEQEANNGGQRGEARRTVVGPGHRIDLSMLDLGCMMFFPKSNPTPIARANPWANIDPVTGTIKPNPVISDDLEAIRPSIEIP